MCVNHAFFLENKAYLRLDSDGDDAKSYLEKEITFKEKKVSLFLHSCLRVLRFSIIFAHSMDVNFVLNITNCGINFVKLKYSIVQEENFKKVAQVIGLYLPGGNKKGKRRNFKGGKGKNPPILIFE